MADFKTLYLYIIANIADDKIKKAFENKANCTDFLKKLYFLSKQIESYYFLNMHDAIKCAINEINPLH
jgi:hypothetical protein